MNWIKMRQFIFAMEYFICLITSFDHLIVAEGIQEDIDNTEKFLKNVTEKLNAIDKDVSEKERNLALRYVQMNKSFYDQCESLEQITHLTYLEVHLSVSHMLKLLKSMLEIWEKKL